MTTYYSMDDYKFVKFRRSQTNNKKYDAIIENKESKKQIILPFGDTRYSQYKDSTGLGFYSHKDTKNKLRRSLFRDRHKGFLKPNHFSPSYFSFNFLW